MASRFAGGGIRAVQRLVGTPLRLRSHSASKSTTRALQPQGQQQQPLVQEPVNRRAVDMTRPDFQTQVFESILERIRREKAQRLLFAIERNRAMTPNLRWSFTAGWTIFCFMCYLLGRAYPKQNDPASTLPLSESKVPSHKTFDANLHPAWNDFVRIVGPDNVEDSDEARAQHAANMWDAVPVDETKMPFCIVYPRTTEHVSKLLKVCHRRMIDVVPYSGGTSLEGHYEAKAGSIVLDMSRMADIVAVHADDHDAVVQPGVGWERLNDELRPLGLFFPPEAGAGALIGGMIGRGSSGIASYRHGGLGEWVLGVTAVLADGTIIRTSQRARRSAVGYDLTRLLIGSEGTLAIVTEVTLKLAPLPQHTSTAVAAFSSLRQAATAATRLAAKGVPLAAIELVDDDQMRCLNDSGMTTRLWPEKPSLLLKFAGSKAAVQEQITASRDVWSTLRGETFNMATNEKEQQELWTARKEALWSVMVQRTPGQSVWVNDVSVPLSRLPELVDATKQDIKQHGLFGAISGHVGDGIFHASIIFNEDQRDTVDDIVRRMMDSAVKMDGTISGESGLGVLKRNFLQFELGDHTDDLMRKMKVAFDPLCILNCERLIRVDKRVYGVKRPMLPAEDPRIKSDDAI